MCVTGIVSPGGEFHPWVEFTLVSGQTYLSVNVFNQGEISPLPYFTPVLKTGAKLTLGVIKHDFNV